jgi:hypothetical protein
MLDRTGNETLIPADAVRLVYRYKPVDTEAYTRARNDFYAYNAWGAGIVCFWLTLAFLMMLGFSYSFFWSAATMIYFLMRKKVDEAELDEVFEDDEQQEMPLAPPKLATAPAPATGPTSLPVLVPPPVSPPPPPATIPFNPSASSSPPPSPPPPPPEPKKPDSDVPLG